VTDFLIKFKRHPNIIRLSGIINNTAIARCHLKGLSGSSVSLFAASVISNSDSDHLFILDDKEEAAYFYNDLESFCPEQKIYFFPSSFKRSYKKEDSDPAGMIQRTELLEKLSNKSERIIVVTYPGALLEKIIPGAILQKMKLQLTEGESVSRDFIVELLTEYGFRETDFVYEPGEFAIRGSIVDVFSYSNDRPFRIDFFGNEVESIRLFDIETQLSETRVQSVTILPDIRNTGEGVDLLPKWGDMFNLVSLLDKKTLMWMADPGLTISALNNLYESIDLPDEQINGKSSIFCNGDELMEELNRYPVLESGQTAFFKESEIIEFRTSPQPVFHKNFELLTETLAGNAEKGYTNYIFSENEKQFERLREIFSEIYGSVPFTPVLAGMYPWVY
jgi:transcription-repair coupling factor (superfamily II helicase)